MLELTQANSVLITGARLKDGAVALIDAIRVVPILRELSDHELVVVHAYVLGFLMEGANMALTSLTKADGLGDLIADGMRDCAIALAAQEQP